MEIINTVKESVNTTLNKYPADEEQFIKVALTKILNFNKYDLFTKDNGARQNMQILGIDVLAIELIRGALISKTIQEQLGEAREISIGRHGFPETVQQAQNYVYQRIEQTESPSIVYAEVKCTESLREFLIANYANLVVTSTPEQRAKANEFLTCRFADKLETLDNLQNYLIDENKNRIFGSYQDDSAIKRRDY